ncbi:hypothetical protein OJAV_G00036410 [Oryzias javanicus]|uniref:BESS domain-containing protein n=1 Tax=Oryzias javanicus TaxID=123683 RepID=A0A3S2Q8W9_ORYJA|nr:hypothetical protein OJAV_G00036410 [Oryzias javanicus]
MPAGPSGFPGVLEREHKLLRIKEEEQEHLPMKEEELEIFQIKEEEPEPVPIKEEEPQQEIKGEEEEEQFEEKQKNGSRRKRKRPPEESVDLEREILRALQAGPHVPPPPPLSETELFMKSLIPMIDSLPPLRRGALKLKIHSLVFESVSEFL